MAITRFDASNQAIVGGGGRIWQKKSAIARHRYEPETRNLQASRRDVLRVYKKQDKSPSLSFVYCDYLTRVESGNTIIYNTMS
mgnify:CR=1 FL=1